MRNFNNADKSILPQTSIKRPVRVISECVAPDGQELEKDQDWIVTVYRHFDKGFFSSC